MANLTSNKPDDLLDPGFDNQPGDYTRYSQGFTADRSKGTRIAGIGELIKDKFTADDAFLKQRIREEATTETDKIRNIFSGMDQRQGGWTLKAVGVEDPDLVSKEITKRGERLKRLDQAYASGRITGTHYWTMLDVAARELRSKYPGYREHIDNVMSDLTGATPANQVVAGIRQDAARDRANDPDKQLKRMVEDAAQAGYLNSTGYHAGPDGLPRDAKGNPVNLGDFINGVSKVRAVHYTREDNAKRLDLDEKAGKANDRDVFRHAQGVGDDVLDGAFRGAIGIVGSPEEVGKKLDQFTADVAAGKALSGEELVKVQAQWAQTRNSIKRQVLNEQMKTPGYQRLTAEQRESLDKNVELRLAQFDDILINKNWGLAIHNKALADQRGNADLNRLIDNSETMRMVNVLNKAGGADLVKNYFSVNPTSFNDLQKVLKNDSLSRMLATGAPIHGEIEKAAKEAGIKNSVYYDTLIDQAVKTVLNPATPKPILDNVIKSLYGPQNSNLLYRHENGQYIPTFPPAKGQEYYAKLTSPEMMKRVLELSRTTGDESYWANYYGWAVRSLQNNGEIHRALQDVKRLSTETDQPFGVQYDPTTASLSVVQRPVINTRRDAQGTFYPSFKARLNEAVSTFNKLSAPMMGIFKETKEDPNRFFNGLFALNGMDPNDLGYKPLVK